MPGKGAGGKAAREREASSDDDERDDDEREGSSSTSKRARVQQPKSSAIEAAAAVDADAEAKAKVEEAINALPKVFDDYDHLWSFIPQHFVDHHVGPKITLIVRDHTRVATEEGYFKTVCALAREAWIKTLRWDGGDQVSPDNVGIKMLKDGTMERIQYGDYMKANIFTIENRVAFYEQQVEGLKNVKQRRKMPREFVVRLRKNLVLAAFGTCNEYYGDQKGCRCGKWMDRGWELPDDFVCGRGLLCISIKPNDLWYKAAMSVPMVSKPRAAAIRRKLKYSNMVILRRTDVQPPGGVQDD